MYKEQYCEIKVIKKKKKKTAAVARLWGNYLMRQFLRVPNSMFKT